MWEFDHRIAWKRCPMTPVNRLRLRQSCYMGAKPWQRPWSLSFLYFEWDLFNVYTDLPRRGLSLVHKQKQNANEDRWLRRILRLRYTDLVSNVEVWARTGQEMAENTVRKRIAKWHGHVTRMKKDLWQSVVHNWKPTGKRPVERPNQRCMDNIAKGFEKS